MGWYDRGWDVAKLAGTVGVDRVLHEIPPPWEGNLFGPIINEILAAAVSAAIVLTTLDGLFRRPVLRLAWQKNNAPERTSEIHFEPVPQHAPARLHVSGVLEGRSVLARWMRRRGYYTTLSLLVEASPKDTLKVTDDQNAHARAGVVSGGFVRMQLADLTKNATAWVAFNIELDKVPAGGQPIYVTLGYEFQRKTRAMKWLDRYLLRQDFGVETIQAIRR